MGRRRVLAAKIVEWVALGAIPVLSGARAKYATPPQPPFEFIDFVHQFFLNWYVIIVLVLGIAAILAKVVQEYLNPESRIRLKAALDVLLDAYFAGVTEGERYLNRVTLFKANRKRTKLEAHCRSGTQYQRDIQPLAISDEDETANEGVAGQAWFKNATVAAALPECPNQWSDADPNCQGYATSGFLPSGKAAKLHVKSRSVLATPVRDFQGRKWGVLVLDSRRPDGINPAPGRDELVRSVAAALGKTL